jgi:hypothetical protein
VAGKIAYLAHPVFTTYAKHSMPFHRDLVLACLERILPTPLLEAEGPTSLQATLTRQDDRHVVHLLHYIPERRGLTFDVVEDRLPVHGVRVRARVPAAKATLVPQGEPLPLQQEDGTVSFVVPQVDGHQMVLLES